LYTDIGLLRRGLFEDFPFDRLFYRPASNSLPPRENPIMTAPQTTSAPYEVGYGKPPRHTQFQKGRSGNPGGRSRQRSATRLRELALLEAYRTVIVYEDGHAVPMPAIQAVLRSQIEIASNGNVRAQRAILAMIDDIEVLVSDGVHQPVNDDDVDVDDAATDEAVDAGDDGDDGDGYAQYANEIVADDERQQEEQDAAPSSAGSAAQPACRPPRRPENAAARLADTPPPVQRWRQPLAPEPPPPPVVPWRERPSRPESYLRRSRRH
jgi:Family of unknown function (DUF5681)